MFDHLSDQVEMEMEGYYVEKTWSVFESQRRKLFASETFVKKAAFRWYENKTESRKRSSKAKKPKISGN